MKDIKQLDLKINKNGLEDYLKKESISDKLLKYSKILAFISIIMSLLIRIEVLSEAKELLTLTSIALCIISIVLALKGFANFVLLGLAKIELNEHTPDIFTDFTIEIINDTSIKFISGSLEAFKMMFSIKIPVKIEEGDELIQFIHKSPAGNTYNIKVALKTAFPNRFDHDEYKVKYLQLLKCEQTNLTNNEKDA